MKEQELQQLKDLIHQSYQSGKSETSGLVSHIEKKIDTSVGLAVERYVNGHLRDMKAHLERQDLKLDNMEVKIDALACETKPIIDSKNTIINMRRFLLWIAAPASALWAFVEFVLKK